MTYCERFYDPIILWRRAISFLEGFLRESCGSGKSDDAVGRLNEPRVRGDGVECPALVLI